MSSKGYFKDTTEYEKANKWFIENNVPSWLQEDINEYYKMMNQDKLETSERILIGG